MPLESSDSEVSMIPKYA